MRKIPFGDMSEKTCFVLVLVYGTGTLLIGIMLGIVTWACKLSGFWVVMSSLWICGTWAIIIDLFWWLLRHGRSMLRNKKAAGAPFGSHLVQKLVNCRCYVCRGSTPVEEVRHGPHLTVLGRESAEVEGSAQETAAEARTASTNTHEIDFRKYMLILAVILPLNSLFLFTQVGAPVFEPSVLEDVASIGPLLEAVKNSTSSDLFVSAGNLLLNMKTQEVRNMSNNATITKISGQSCYQPGTPEFKLLGSLQGEDMPKQASCESMLGSSLAESLGFITDSDNRWEEIYDFSCRVFITVGGLVGERLIEGSAGGLLVDLTDSFDMLMLSFQNVVQLNDGLNQLEGFLQVVDFVVFTNYLGLIFRCFHSLDIGHSIVRPCFKCSGLEHFIMGPRGYNEQDAKKVVGASMSFIFELSFLSIRLLAFCFFEVPMSVLAMKNLFGIYDDWQQLVALRTLHAASHDETSSPTDRA